MPEYHSALYPDTEIEGQKFVCISFLKPQKDDLVAEKERFYGREFSKYFAAELKKVEQFKSENPNKKLSLHMEAFYKPTDKTVDEMYDGFVKFNKEKLDKKFNKKFNKEELVTERAVKVRGAFKTMEEASAHAKELSDKEGNLFDIYVATMGTWLLFNPRADITAEYADEKLNELIVSTEKEKAKRDFEFEQRKLALQQKMKEELEMEEEEESDDEEYEVKM